MRIEETFFRLTDVAKSVCGDHNPDVWTYSLRSTSSGASVPLLLTMMPSVLFSGRWGKFSLYGWNCANIEFSSASFSRPSLTAVCWNMPGCGQFSTIQALQLSSIEVEPQGMPEHSLGKANDHVLFVLAACLLEDLISGSFDAGWFRAPTTLYTRRHPVHRQHW